MNAFCSGVNGGATGATGFATGAFDCARLTGAVAKSNAAARNAMLKFILWVKLCKDLLMRVVISTWGGGRKPVLNASVILKLLVSLKLNCCDTVVVA